MAGDPLRTLRFTLFEDLCPVELKKSFLVEIRKVRGQEPTVVPGKQYAVRGRYVTQGTAVRTLCLSSHGRSTGKSTDVHEGSGDFEVTAEVLEVTPGREKVLDLLMFGADGKELGVRVRLSLEGGQ